MKRLMAIMAGTGAGIALAYYLFDTGVMVSRPFLVVFLLIALAALCFIISAFVNWRGSHHVPRRVTSHLLIMTSIWSGALIGLIVIRASVFYFEYSNQDNLESDSVLAELSAVAKSNTHKNLANNKVLQYDSILQSLRLEKHELPGDLLDSTNRLDDRINLYLQVLDERRVLILIAPHVGWYAPDQRSSNLPSLAQLKAMVSYIALVDVSDGLDIVALLEIDGVQLARSLIYDQDTGALTISSIKLHEDCLTLEVHRLSLLLDPFMITDMESIFETSPCFSHHTALHQHGARLAHDVDGSVLLSIGDFRLGVDRVNRGLLWNGRPVEMQWPNSYGMIFRLLDNGQHEVISTGHRNPQGLAVDAKTGTIWSTEHGPRGGDELNRIIQGADYGWPNVTYGVPYDYPPMPEGEWESGRWSNHAGYELPKFAWLPSIGASQLLVYYGNEFPAWNGDLLVSTLSNRSLRRIRLDEGQVIYDERIRLEHRMRDIATDAQGRLLMTTDDGYLLRLSNAHE
jgi:hypothetical protein